jgi:hypothetical protein
LVPDHMAPATWRTPGAGSGSPGSSRMNALSKKNVAIEITPVKIRYMSLQAHHSIIEQHVDTMSA